MDKSPLAEEAKKYQKEFDYRLPKKSYAILQLDGRAFHTYTKGLERPFDDSFINAMNETAKAVVSSVTNAKFAYVQSDEINIFLSDFDHDNQEAFYNNRIHKVVSTSAGLASAFMSRIFPDKEIAVFDARFFATPTKEATKNFFIWRQLDAVKNSIQATGQAHISKKSLHSKHSGMIKKELLELGIDWENFDEGRKQGRLISRKPTKRTVTFTHGKTQEVSTIEVDSNPWIIENAPFFMDSDFLDKIIPEKQ